tara:strand:- start:14599 stop:16173 length:1575 start_codon:yes stop_codon:yes gene_type:complete
MTNFYKIKETIDSVYSKGYFERYGGSVVIAFLFIIIILYLIAYSHIRENIHEIKENWSDLKCKPQYIPFAGHIMDPPDGTDPFLYSFNNFKGCMNESVQFVVENSMKPITSIISGLVVVVNMMGQRINNIWESLKYLRDKMYSMFEGLFNKIYILVIELNKLLYKVNDTISKLLGVVGGIFHSLMTFIMTLKSFFGASYEILRNVAIFFIMLAITLFAIPFVGWPAAWVAAGIASVMVTFLTIYSIILAPYVDLSRYYLPSVWTPCFSGDTEIMMSGGSLKKIKDIKVGEYLADKSYVTSCFELVNPYHYIYRIDNICVTGEHKIMKDGIFMSVKESGLGVKEEFNDIYLYCLNTSSKHLHIGSYTFKDYDEITDDENKLLYTKLNLDINEKYDYHFEGGFHPDTMIELSTGIKKNIKDIIVGNVLKNDITVLAVVRGIERNCDKFSTIWDDNGNEIICSPNILISTHLNTKIRGVTVGKRYCNIKYINRIKTTTIHLITDTGNISIGSNYYMDFNSMTEFYLE